MRLPTFEQLPFIVRLLLDPVRALDLVDDCGAPDHTKLVPFAVLAGVFTLKLIGSPFTVAELALVIPASFGAAMYRQFLRVKQLTIGASEVTSTTTVVNDTRVLARRDPDVGVDPTHE